MNDWVDYYLRMAMLVATKSKDPSTKHGAVIVSPDNSVIATGYNGLPKGIADTPERLNNRELKYRMVIHAEKNAIYTAARNLTGHTMFVTGAPCGPCAAAICQVGIVKVICIKPDAHYLARWEIDREIAMEMFDEKGIIYIEHDTPGTFTVRGENG